MNPYGNRHPAGLRGAEYIFGEWKRSSSVIDLLGWLGEFLDRNTGKMIESRFFYLWKDRFTVASDDWKSYMVSSMVNFTGSAGAHRFTAGLPSVGPYAQCHVVQYPLQQSGGWGACMAAISRRIDLIGIGYAILKSSYPSTT